MVLAIRKCFGNLEDLAIRLCIVEKEMVCESSFSNISGEIDWYIFTTLTKLELSTL